MGYNDLDAARALAKRSYLLLALNTMLDRIQVRATELIDEDRGDFEVNEWLAEFDLNEREYSTMVQLRADLIEAIAVTTHAMAKEGSPPAAPVVMKSLTLTVVRDVVESLLEISEENNIPLPAPPGGKGAEAALEDLLDEALWA